MEDVQRATPWGGACQSFCGDSTERLLRGRVQSLRRHELYLSIRGARAPWGRVGKQRGSSDRHTQAARVFVSTYDTEVSFLEHGESRSRSFELWGEFP